MDVVDGYHGSLKAKRARATQVKHKSTINLFNKISDMIEKLAELVDIQELTDTTILQVRIDRIDHHTDKNEWGKNEKLSQTPSSYKHIKGVSFEKFCKQK